VELRCAVVASSTGAVGKSRRGKRPSFTRDCTARARKEGSVRLQFLKVWARGGEADMHRGAFAKCCGCWCTFPEVVAERGMTTELPHHACQHHPCRLRAALLTSPCIAIMSDRSFCMNNRTDRVELPSRNVYIPSLKHAIFSFALFPMPMTKPEYSKQPRTYSSRADPCRTGTGAPSGRCTEP
jgi:hypothetical protein